MGHFPLQIYNVKHKITLSPRFAIQKRNSEVILAKTIVKSPEENGPVLQFYKRYGFPEVVFSEWLESVRKDVECAFGILKIRFRFLRGFVVYHDANTIENAFKVQSNLC